MTTSFIHIPQITSFKVATGKNWKEKYSLSKNIWFPLTAKFMSYHISYRAHLCSFHNLFILNSDFFSYFKSMTAHIFPSVLLLLVVQNCPDTVDDGNSWVSRLPLCPRVYKAISAVCIAKTRTSSSPINCYDTACLQLALPESRAGSCPAMAHGPRHQHGSHWYL